MHEFRVISRFSAMRLNRITSVRSQVRLLYRQIPFLLFYYLRSFAARALGSALILATTTWAAGAQPDIVQSTVQQFCVSCHGGDKPEAGLDLDSFLTKPIEQHPEVWEKVVRRLRGRQMPPADEEDRPDEPRYVATLSQLEAALLKPQT